VSVLICLSLLETSIHIHCRITNLRCDPRAGRTRLRCWSKGRRVRIDGSQLHAYYVTWLEGKKQQFENVGKDALSAWQAKLTR